jgi:nucleoid-associated protein YgaU
MSGTPIARGINWANAIFSAAVKLSVMLAIPSGRSPLLGNWRSSRTLAESFDQPGEEGVTACMEDLMRKRMNIVVVACLIALSAVVWMVSRTQRSLLQTAAAPVNSPVAPQAVPVQIEVVQVPVATGQPSPAPAAEPPLPIARPIATPAEFSNVEVVRPATAQLDREPKVSAKPVRVLKYIAVPGDTVGKMAAAFLGGEDQATQDLILNANPSLKANPDHVEAGQSYRIPVPEGLSAVTSAAAAAPRPTTQPDADQIVVAGSPKTLSYTAHAGDTVSKMAIQLLGSDSQAARDAIINSNPTLKKDPDRVIAGQTYFIPAPTASADVR